MEKIYFLHKLFWALIFIFIDINIIIFDIMHDSIGWFLLLQGLNQLNNKIKVKKRIHLLIVFFLIESIFIIFFHSSMNNGHLIVYNLALTFLLFYLLYELFQLLFTLSKERNFTRKTSYHLFFTIIYFSGLIVYHNFTLFHFNHDVVNTSFLILIILFLLWFPGLLIHIDELKKALSKPLINLSV